MADPAGNAPVGVGIVGCGNIFESYITGLRKLRSVRVLGCADIDQARAEASRRAAEELLAENVSDAMAAAKLERALYRLRVAEVRRRRRDHATPPGES